MRTIRPCNRAVGGFTLPELLITAGVVAFLFVMIFRVCSVQLEKSREAADLAQVRAVYSQMIYTSILEDKAGEYDGIPILRQDDGSYEAMIQPLIQRRDAWALDARDLAVGGVGIGDPAWIGAPKGRGSCTLRYFPLKNRMTIDWGGNDLNTVTGRRQEDIDNMHAIASALLDAREDERLNIQGDYVEVAVFRDGTVALFQDGGPTGRASTAEIRDALEHAGLSAAYIPLNSTDAGWKHGYLVHCDSQGTVSYKALTAEDNRNKAHVILSTWQARTELTDRDLMGSAE